MFCQAPHHNGINFGICRSFMDIFEISREVIKSVYLVKFYEQISFGVRVKGVGPVFGFCRLHVRWAVNFIKVTWRRE